MVGIIGPWNFPLNLVVLPAAAAFAAGNRVMIKMSEITPRTAALMKELAPKYFDATELAVVTGGRDVAATFTTLPFDHLFFTGSPDIGALVQRAAAQNLVPVTLELGGKNPVVVAPRQSADIEKAAARIAAARMVNGGQVCVCPDYVFVPEGRLDAFLAAARTDVAGRCSRRSWPTPTTARASTNRTTTAYSDCSTTPVPRARRWKRLRQWMNCCPIAPAARSPRRSCTV